MRLFYKQTNIALILVNLVIISSCTFSFNRDKEDKIIIEKLEPIQDTKLDCDAHDLTKLEVAKCKMEAKLLELKY